MSGCPLYRWSFQNTIFLITINVIVSTVLLSCIILQGVTFWPIDDELPPHRSGVYMIDLGSNDTKLFNLTFEGSYRETNSPDFTPHGMGYWVTKDGEMILYIINHRHRGDTVDSFVYNPKKKSLKY